VFGGVYVECSLEDAVSGRLATHLRYGRICAERIFFWTLSLNGRFSDHSCGILPDKDGNFLVRNYSVFLLQKPKICTIAKICLNNS
jgi:hypothetical protein